MNRMFPEARYIFFIINNYNLLNGLILKISKEDNLIKLTKKIV